MVNTSCLVKHKARYSLRFKIKVKIKSEQKSMRNDDINKNNSIFAKQKINNHGNR